MEDLDIQIQMLATPEKVLDYFPKENNPDDSTPPYQFNVLENNLLMTQMFFHDSNTPLLNIKINIRRDLNVPINKITRITALTIIAVAICMWIYLAAAFLINQNMLNTKNQDMELKLDQTRDWFFKIFKSKTVFVVITRLDTGEIVEVNTELIEALNYTQDEIIGKTITELGVYKNEEERKAVTKTIQDKGYGRDLYLQLPTKDNRIVHVSVSSDLIDYKGNACILNVLIDVTQRKKLETDLKKAKLDASQATANTEIKNHQLAVEVNQRNQVEKTNQALFDISNAVNTTRDLDELYAHIHRILGTIMKLDNFYIASYNKEEDRVTFPYWHDEKNISSEDIDNISKRISLTVEVIKSGKPLIAYKKDFEPGGRFFEWGFSDTAAKNWLGIPLKIKKDVIGVMVTQNYSGQEEYTDKDINLMGTVSDQVALAIERKSAQDALLQSEIKYRSIIEEVQDGYCETDIYGRITFFNKSLCRISGYKEKELSGKNFSDLIQGTKKLNEVLQTDPDSNETRIKLKQKDGALKHMGIRPAPVIDVNGEQKGYRTFVHDIDEQKKHEEKLVFLAYHDSLTGLHNRKAFYEYLTGILNQAKRDPNNVALVFMDIDKFKKVNDTLSHEKGDALLKEIASRLTEILRKTDYISRIGGDEFTVVMTGKSAFNPIELAEKILEAIRLPYHLGRDAVDYVSTSIGVSIYPDDSAEDAEDLVHQADQAMYEAKKTGDTFVFYKDI
ncbi:MAG: diguanylate cyclase [Desulfobacteraceae bacterium]|nr:diguanylate cyclase [Desulfobacteraceae bacterium]